MNNNSMENASQKKLPTVERPEQGTEYFQN